MLLYNHVHNVKKNEITVLTLSLNIGMYENNMLFYYYYRKPQNVNK